jgi:hypothetical protein
MTGTREDLIARNADFDRAVHERDRALAESVLHPDYALVLVHPEPAVMPRQRWLEVLDDYVVHAWENHAQDVVVCGDTGSILTLVTMEATVLGQDRSGLFVISDTWLHGDEGWRVWRRHSSPMTAGRMPGAD